MQVAVGANIDDEVIDVQAAAKIGQDLVAAAARPQRDANRFGAPAAAPSTGNLIQLAIRAIGGGVEKRGGDIGRRVRRLQQIDAHGRRAGGGR